MGRPRKHDIDMRKLMQDNYDYEDTPVTPETRREYFEQYWLTPGTRCAKIMQAIEAGMTDEEIARRMNAKMKGQDMCTSQDIYVYRLVRARALEMDEPEIPEPCPAQQQSPRREMTEEDKKVLALWESGMGSREIAKKLDMKSERVAHVLYYRLDVKRRHRPTRMRAKPHARPGRPKGMPVALDMESLQRGVEMLRAGARLKELAEALDISRWQAEQVSRYERTGAFRVDNKFTREEREKKKFTEE